MPIPAESKFRISKSCMYFMRQYRVFQWLFALCCVYLFWWSIPHVIDTSGSVTIQISQENLKQLPGQPVTDLEDSHWLERMQDIVENCKVVCQTKHYDVITQKSIRWNGERMTESFAYFCKKELALINLRMDPLSQVKDDNIACVESYDTLERRVRRFRTHQLSGIDLDDIDQGRQVYRGDDPVDSCLYHHTVDIIESKWHI